MLFLLYGCNNSGLKEESSAKEDVGKVEEGGNENVNENEQISPPKLQLQGIVYNEKDPNAIVSGQIVKAGDTVQSAEVIEVGTNYVKFKFEDKFFSLTIADEELKSEANLAKAKVYLQKDDLGKSLGTRGNDQAPGLNYYNQAKNYYSLAEDYFNNYKYDLAFDHYKKAEYWAQNCLGSVGLSKGMRSEVEGFIYGCRSKKALTDGKIRERSQLISEGKIAIGMTKQQVIWAWGEPASINRTVGNWLNNEQWVYGYYRQYETYDIEKQKFIMEKEFIPNKYLYFKSDFLTSFQD